MASEKVRSDHPWKVILYNDDFHTFEEVVYQLQKALDCSLLRAVELTYLAHARNQSIIYKGAFEKCHVIINTLREIDLDVKICG